MWRFKPGSEALTAAVFHGASIPTDPGTQEAVDRMLRAGVLHPGAFDGGGDELVGAIAVVIPVRDDTAGLTLTVASVQRAIKDGAAVGECIIVDDGSATPVSVDDHVGVPLRVLRHDRSEGPGAARNTGWRAAKSRAVLFLDTDMTVTADLIERLDHVLMLPSVGIVAPRTQQATGVGAFQAACAVTSSLDLGDAPALVRRQSPVSYVPACALLVDRSCLELLNGFDPEMQSGEDVDFVWRAETAGIVTRYEPSVMAVHGARTSGSALQRRFVYGSSSAALARRHSGAVAACVLRPSSPAILGYVLFGKWKLATFGLAIRTLSDVQTIRSDEATRPFAFLAARKLNSAEILGAADALCRPYWPLSMLGFLHPRTRMPVAIAMATSVIARCRRRGAPIAASTLIWQVADDAAYSAGVLSAALHAREPGALLPRRSTFRRRSTPKAMT